MTIKITFFGKSGAGKTKFVQRMLKPELPISYETMTTFGVEINAKEIGRLLLEISNLSGQHRYRQFQTVFYKSADIAVYCVDLTEPVDNEEINADISAFRAINPDAEIILLGTKADLCPETAQASLDSITNEDFVDRFSLSAHNDEDLTNFLQQLVQFGKQLLPKKVATMDKADLAGLKIDLLLYARDQLPPQSPFYQALDNLAESSSDLPKGLYRKIGKEAFNLVNAFSSKDSSVDISQAIENFSDNCRRLLPVSHSYVEIAILSVVTTVTVTLLVALAGFAVGCIFGLWAGPMAFLSGIATSYAAVSLLAVSGAAGLGSGFLTAYGLFRQEITVQTAVIDEIAEAASNYNPGEVMPI